MEGRPQMCLCMVQVQVGGETRLPCCGKCGASASHVLPTRLVAFGIATLTAANRLSIFFKRGVDTPSAASASCCFSFTNSSVLPTEEGQVQGEQMAGFLRSLLNGGANRRDWCNTQDACMTAWASSAPPLSNHPYTATTRPALSSSQRCSPCSRVCCMTQSSCRYMSLMIHRLIVECALLEVAYIYLERPTLSPKTTHG
jgi:hypothetical protein